MTTDPDGPFALLLCAAGTAELSRDDMALLLTALQVAGEDDGCARYRLLEWRVRDALGMVTG